MKNYINKTERGIFIKVALLSGHLQSMGKMDLDPEELKSFRMSFTYLVKASNHLINRLDSKFASQLRREIDSSDYLVVTNSRGKIDMEDNQRINDSIDVLADKALVWCKGCKETNSKECKLRQALSYLEVTHYTCGDIRQICPYQIITEEA